MSYNVLIGIGGTGSRVVEAMVHLCAAGYGPDQLALFLIDPDEGNGNLTRTKTLIDVYKQCRQNFEPTPNTKGKLFKTEIKTPERLVWSIFKERGTRLREFVKLNSLDEKLQHLASILFSEKELVTPLDEGFRGHPSIGAVVMANPDQEEEPWTILWEDITSKKQNEVRVFLAGSVFGGTGAAGVPTIGSKNVLKFHPNAKIGDQQSRVLLGGALVLPYFTIEKESETEESMYVTHYDFPIATKAALHYYNEKELGFDQLYFVGDSLNQKVGKFSVGSQTQENRPHYIELVTSLAAIDFFEQPPLEGDPERMYFISARDSEEITWDSLPVSRDTKRIRERQVLLKRSLVTMTTFAYAFCTYGQNILSQSHGEIEDAWYRDHFKFKENREKDREKNPRWGEHKTHINNFQKYLKNYFLAWICSLDDESQKVKLIHRDKLCDGDIQVGKGLNLLDYAKNTYNIGGFLREESRQNDFGFFINNALNVVDLTREKTLTAGNKFINLFYEAAIKFSVQNYNIQ